MKRLLRFLHNLRALLLRPATSQRLWVAPSGTLYLAHARHIDGITLAPLVRPVAGFSQSGQLLMQQ